MTLALGPLGRLVLITLSCISQIIIICAIGYVMAQRGILDKGMQSKLNKLNVMVFTPALLFGKVAFDLTPKRLTELAIVPLGFLLVCSVSALAAVITSRLMRVLPGQRKFVMACAITPNSNTLPVALISSLVYSVPELHWVENGQDSDRPELMLGRALTYLVMFSTLGTIQRWSIAAKLLGQVKGVEMPAHFVADSNRSGFCDDVTDNLIDYRHRSQYADRNSLLIYERDSSDAPAHAPLLSEEPEQVDSLTPSRAPEPTGWKRLWAKYVVRPWHVFIEFMTVPLWASLLSFAIVLVPPVQKLLGSLDFFVGSIEDMGQCSIPLSILVLGSYFSGSDAPGTDLVNQSLFSAFSGEDQQHNEGEERRRAAAEDWEKRMTWRTIIAASVSRMIVSPLLLTPVVAFVCLTNDAAVVGDPVFITCALLVIGSPPALTLAQISRNRGDPNSNLEALISGTIFVSYIFLTAPVTILLVFIALYIDKMQALYT